MLDEEREWIMSEALELNRRRDEAWLSYESLSRRGESIRAAAILQTWRRIGDEIQALKDLVMEAE